MQYLLMIYSNEAEYAKLDPATGKKMTEEFEAFTKDIVQSVQKALSKLGYDVGTPDGLAGKKTADAIKSFEAATGMSQVGLINPRLLAVLGSQPV